MRRRPNFLFPTILLIAGLLIGGVPALAQVDNPFNPNPFIEKDHHCRDAAVERRIAVLKRGIEGADSAIDRLTTQITDAELGDDPRRKRELKKWHGQRQWWVRVKTDEEEELKRLEALPPCNVDTPKTASPPSQPLPPRVAHRTSICRGDCQYWADQYNEAADNYALARGAGPPEAAAYYRAQMQEFARQLDLCEQRCRPQTLTVPAPAPTPATPPAPAPSPAPQPPPPPPGAMMPLVPGAQFYAGVTGGGATARSQVKQPGETSVETSFSTPDPTSKEFGLSGGLAGGLFGVETLSGPWRLGVESDIAGGEISGKTTAGCGVPCRTSNHWLATVRGRAGFDFGLATPYVTGGLAVGDVNARIGALPGGNTVAAGWTAGAGLQWPLAALGFGLPDTLTGRLEWLHVDLGNPRVCGPKNCGGTTNASFSSDIFRVGIAIPLSALLPR